MRRTAYAAARLQAIADEIDPNGKCWQAQYFAQEYAALRNLPVSLLIGWTRVFKGRPSGTPHTERRQAEAQRIWGLITREEQRWAQANWRDRPSRRSTAPIGQICPGTLAQLQGGAALTQMRQ